MAMKRAKSTATKTKQSNKLHKARSPKLPFIEHVYELRKRLFYVAISVALFGGAAYAVEHEIVAALLKPAHGQKFIYTSPGGGIDFLFRVCLYVGIACSIPVIVYQGLRYMEPLIKKDSVRFIALGSAASGVLAAAGMTFGYFIGLPSALKFLLHQFTTSQIQPLLTIQSYMSFVTMYMLGSAMLFQLPLILLFINRIKPLKPQKLLRFERWIILLAFVLGGVMNPSPNIADQLLLAGPMILMYQLGILIIWLVNRKHTRPKHVATLLKRDAEIRAAREQQFRAAQAELRQKRAQAQLRPAAAIAPKPQPLRAVAKPAAAKLATPPSLARPPRRPVHRQRTYINDFTRRPYQNLQQFPRTESA
jgi:sec-independent protein translocase protein TatC